jgi:outer membrane protein OmpA-like peptidoglycan-associated protein
MDKQAAEIQRDLDGAKVERIGEGIKITFDSGLLFDVNKAAVKPAGQQNLTELAVILNKYPDTNILLEGHTDSDGTEEHNLNLSELRAKSVANYLAGQQVMETRFTTMGYGESQPIADNSTSARRAASCVSHRFSRRSHRTRRPRCPRGRRVSVRALGPRP